MSNDSSTRDIIPSVSTSVPPSVSPSPSVDPGSAAPAVVVVLGAQAAITLGWALKLVPPDKWYWPLAGLVTTALPVDLRKPLVGLLRRFLPGGSSR